MTFIGIVLNVYFLRHYSVLGYCCCGSGCNYCYCCCCSRQHNRKSAFAKSEQNPWKHLRKVMKREIQKVKKKNVTNKWNQLWINPCGEQNIERVWNLWSVFFICQKMCLSRSDGFFRGFDVSYGTNNVWNLDFTFTWKRKKKISLNWRNTVKITNFNTYPTNSTQKRDDSWKYSKICFVVYISVSLSCFLSLSLEIPLSTHANLIWSYVLMGFRYIACNQHNIFFSVAINFQLSFRFHNLCNFNV